MNALRVATLVLLGPSFVLLCIADKCGGSCDYESDNLLTYEEKPCTTMRTGMVRFTNEKERLEICAKKQWHSYSPRNFHVDDLIGHWRMDEQTGNKVADDSGNENHGSAIGPVPTLSKFTRGRYFNSDGIISIPNNNVLNFGISSFSVTGWLKILDVAYPRTTFAVKKGHGCYFGPGRQGWVPGWETAHGYKANGLRVCIRDKENRKVDKTIVFDDGYQPAQLIGKWTHYVVVFDREQQKKVFTYINGKKQSNSLDISPVQGSVDNDKALEFGVLYGWKTKGTLDEYRIYKRALNEYEVTAVFRNHIA